MGKITIGLLFTLVLIISSGCGVGISVCKSSYDQFNGFCDTVVGYDKDERDLQAKHDQDIKQIQDELKTQQLFLQMLEISATSWNDQLVRQLGELTENQEQIYSLIYTNTDNIGLIGNQLFLLNQQVSNTIYTLSSIQDQINDVQYRIITLENPNIMIDETIDFCGDNPGRIDEIGLRLANGTLITVQKIYGKNILVKIAPGTYETQDGTNCAYTVDLNGNVTWEN